MTDLEKDSHEVFAKARKVDFQVPPFLETRVLAVLREREGGKARHSLWIWKSVSAFSGFLALTLVAWIALHSSPVPDGRSLSATTDHPVVVRVELGDLKQYRQIVRVQIDLPSGVHFHSQAHEDLAAASSVVLTVDPATGRSYVPFAIKADTAGKKPIFVRFLDQDSRVIAERLLDIDFKLIKEPS